MPRPSFALLTLLLASSAGAEPPRELIVDLPWTSAGGVPVYTPDGQRAARRTSAWSDELLLLHATSGAVLAARRPPATPHLLTFSPDGRTLFVLDAGRRLAAWDLTTDVWRLAELPVAPDLSPVAALPSPDGRRLLVGFAKPYGHDGAWVLLQATDLRVLATGALRDVVDQTLAWWPGGQVWVAAQGGAQLLRRDADGAALDPLASPVPPRRLALSPDGARLGVAGGGGGLVILDGDGRALQLIPPAPTGPGQAWQHLAWSPDSRALAGLWSFASEQDGMIVVLGGDGHVARSAPTLPGRTLLWDAAGRRLLVQNVIAGVTAIFEPGRELVRALRLPANDPVAPLPDRDLLLTPAGPRPWPTDEPVPEDEPRAWTWLRAPEGAAGLRGTGGVWWPLDVPRGALSPAAHPPDAPPAEVTPTGLRVRWAGGGLPPGALLTWPATPGQECVVRHRDDQPGYGRFGPHGAWARLFCTDPDQRYRELVLAWTDPTKPPVASAIDGADQVVASPDGHHLLVAWNQRGGGVRVLRLPDLVERGLIGQEHVALPGELRSGVMLGTGGAELVDCTAVGLETCAMYPPDARRTCIGFLMEGSCAIRRLDDPDTIVSGAPLPGLALSGTSVDGRWIVLYDPDHGACLYDRPAKRCTPIAGVDPTLPGNWAFPPSGATLLRAAGLSLGPDGTSATLTAWPLSPKGLGAPVSLGEHDPFVTWELSPGVLAEPRGRWLHLIRLTDGVRLDLTAAPAAEPTLVAVRDGELIGASSTSGLAWRGADEPLGARHPWTEVPGLDGLRAFLSPR